MNKSLLNVLMATVATLSLSASSFAQSTLSPAQARAAIEPLYQSFNAGSDVPNLVMKATSANWQSCGSLDQCKTREQLIPQIQGFFKAIPDLKWEIKEVLVDGNRVIVRGEASGTPVSDFMGVAPAGKGFKIMSIDIHTVDNGKLTKVYHVEDWIGAVRQLSAK